MSTSPENGLSSATGGAEQSRLTGNRLGSAGVSSMVTVRRRQELPYLGHMLTYRAYGLQQFLLGAFEFLAPVLQLDRVNCIHSARIERLEA
jgi:hypothetical protein